MTARSYERLLAAVDGRRGVEAADRLCEVCVSVLDVDAAAISLVFDGVNNGTLGSSDDSARRYDELQFMLGEGPCLDAVAGRAPVLVHDLASAQGRRWPAYTPAMLDLRVSGVFAVPVVVAGQHVGSLDLFRTRPGVFDDDHLSGAAAAANLAGIPLLDLLDEDLHAAIADPHSDAWADLNALSRAQLSQATGMLVAQLGVEPAEALIRLRAHAYATGRSVPEVARDILEQGLVLDDD